MQTTADTEATVTGCARRRIVCECGDGEAVRDSKDVKGSESSEDCRDIDRSASSKDNEASEGRAKKA
jgi:hypothetical protein